MQNFLSKKKPLANIFYKMATILFIPRCVNETKYIFQTIHLCSDIVKWWLDKV